MPDIQTNIYENFEDETYDKFINESKNIFEKFKTECNPNNKNLVKVSEYCDAEFKYNYIHGGYECGDDGKWNNKCVPSYCDPGYFFDQKNKQCVKDICSSIPIQILIEESTIPDLITTDFTDNIESEDIIESDDDIKPIEKETKKNRSNKIYFSFNNLFCLLLFVL